MEQLDDYSTVLVVEDDALLRAGVVDTLEEMGFSCQEAACAIEAIGVWAPV